jgi:transposase
VGQAGTIELVSREAGKLDHAVRPILPAQAKRCVKRQVQAGHAEAICEAATWPSRRLVPVSRDTRQASVVVFRARDLPVRRRMPCINGLRGHMVGYGYERICGSTQTGALKPGR